LLPTEENGEAAMDILMKAEVMGSDGRLGSVAGVLMKPKTYHVTHLVIAEGEKKARTEFTVLIQQIAHASGKEIRLSCNRDVLEPKTAVPDDEIMLNSEARAKASDGFIGHIHKLVVTPKTGHISSIVVETRGLLQRPRYVSLPDTLLGQVETNALHVKLDRHNFSILRPA
jgi:sporulation protein YlmC with PRC-barrel domain